MRETLARPSAAWRRRRTYKAGTVLLLAMSGCAMVGPDFEPPQPPVAETWLASDDPRVETTAPEDAEWWQTFNDPTLSNLIRIAQQLRPEPAHPKRAIDPIRHRLSILAGYIRQKN